jgi:hypothetical protein
MGFAVAGRICRVQTCGTADSTLKTQSWQQVRGASKGYLFGEGAKWTFRIGKTAVPLETASLTGTAWMTRAGQPWIHQLEFHVGAVLEPRC